MTTRCSGVSSGSRSTSGMPMFPPRTAGWTGSAARIAAISDDVVVLPFVPVTPIVGAGHRRRNRSGSETSAGRVRIAAGARRDQRLERGPQPRLGRRVVGVDRRRGRRRAPRRPRPRPGPRRARASSSTSRPSSCAIARSSSAAGRAVVDRDPGARVGEEPRQRDAAPGEAEHRHRPAAQRARRGRRRASARRGRSGVVGRHRHAHAALDRGQEQRHAEEPGEDARRSRTGA